jgi:4-amino-4-deoxy-L-arabinose transferase-like glycosyltransferase
MLKDKIKKNKWELALFFVILFLGIFFRAYHFSDWLHFEIDQTYDTLLVSPAVQDGISNLPLLGPTAGGGRSLRLGPSFYYMEYLSAWIFGDNPVGHAMQVLILSILAISLFYFFCRRYFSVEVSLGLLAIFSTSLYLVLYSRFSWSPNVLPFLALAAFYSLLRSVSENEKNKDKWFIGTVFIASIASQIHFSSFFTVPLVFAAFLLIKRPKFKLKVWLLAVFTLLLVYSPVVLSDIKTGGQNLKYFSEKLGLDENSAGQKESDQGKKSIGEKIFQDFRYSSLEYFLAVSGVDKINGKRFKGYDAGLLCKTCRADFPARILGIILFFAGLIILAFNLKREKDVARKDFLWLCGLWFSSFFLFLFLITYDGFYIYPRFFLLAAPLSIICAGFILEKINPEKDRIRLAIFTAIIIAISWMNGNRVIAYFDQLKKASQEEIQVETEDVFPNNARITLAQQMQIISYMEAKHKDNRYPIYIKSIHEYDPVFWYHLNKKNIPFDDFILADTGENVYKEGNYFIIEMTAANPKKNINKYLRSFDILETRDFGALIVYNLKPKPEAETVLKQDLSQKKPTMQSIQIGNILTWKKLFSR